MSINEQKHNTISCVSVHLLFPFTAPRTRAQQTWQTGEHERPFTDAQHYTPLTSTTNVADWGVRSEASIVASNALS